MHWNNLKCLNSAAGSLFFAARYITHHCNSIAMPNISVAGRADTALRSPLLQAIAPAWSDVAVELGCGTGRLTVQYFPLVARTVAIDFSLASLNASAMYYPASCETVSCYTPRWIR